MRLAQAREQPSLIDADSDVLHVVPLATAHGSHWVTTRRGQKNIDAFHERSSAAISTRTFAGASKPPPRPGTPAMAATSRAVRRRDANRSRSVDRKNCPFDRAWRKRSKTSRG